MDLRKLYEAIMTTNHLRRTLRVNVNKKCFILHYEINNKILIFKNIKRVHKNPNRRVKSYRKNTYYSWLPLNGSTNGLSRSPLKRFEKFKTKRSFEQSSSFTLKSFSSSKILSTCHVKTQTPRSECLSESIQIGANEKRDMGVQAKAFSVELLPKSTQTPVKVFKTQQTCMVLPMTYTKCEQTSVSVFSQGIQSEVNKGPSMVSFGVQTKSQTSNVANQTEEYFCTMATQTINSNPCRETQTELYNCNTGLYLFGTDIVSALGVMDKAIVSQNQQFEYIIKKIDELSSWIDCFRKFFKKRNPKSRASAFSDSVEDEMSSKIDSIY